jgi:hypothetical protein
MNYKKKEKLYITELIKDPPITYPMYYIVSSHLKENELFHSALFAVHLGEYENHQHPKNATELFSAFSSGTFAIYKEQYIVSQFGGRLMYLESAGWKSMQVTEDIFDLNQWLI